MTRKKIFRNISFAILPRVFLEFTGSVKFRLNLPESGSQAGLRIQVGIDRINPQDLLIRILIIIYIAFFFIDHNYF